MNKINILDPSEIDHWLEGIAFGKSPERAKETARLLSIALKRHFLADETTAALLSSPPAHAPAWALNKWDVAGPFHRFAPEQDPHLPEKINHITDWLVAAQVNDAPFLKDLDGKSGKPKLLLHIKSVDDACAQADKYSAAQRQFAKAALKGPDHGSLRIMNLEDGMHIVEVATQEARKREGALMQHCVGDGAYDAGIAAGRTKIYSLRDKNNQPHATFEVDLAENALMQCKGKQNTAPVEKYLPYVAAFVQKKKLMLVEETRYTHLLQKDNGDVYSIFSLPEKFSTKGSVSLKGCANLATLPKGFSAGGNVDLSFCRALTTLPERFSAGGDVNLMECTALVAVQEGFSAKGDVIFWNCIALTTLPNKFSVKGSINLEGCTALTTLPEGFSAGGEVRLLGCRALTALPKGFSAGGDVSLWDCKALASLPEGLSVKGSIDLRGCTALTALPKGFSAKGVVNLGGCTALTALPEKCPSPTMVVMPDRTEVKPKDWAKARAEWMKARGLKVDAAPSRPSLMARLWKPR